MQIGIKVDGFTNIDGVLSLSLRITFTHPDVDRPAITGSAPFRANNAQIDAIARQLITDQFGVAVPANADVQIR